MRTAYRPTPVSSLGDESNKSQKRKRADEEMAPSRRSTNACRRCKDKKIKCHFGSASHPSTCAPCAKAKAECEFAVAPDGIPRGAAYIKELESKVATLEADLRTANSAVLSPARTHQSAPISSSLSPATQNPRQYLNTFTNLRQPTDTHPLGIRRRGNTPFASSPRSRLSFSGTSRSSSKKRESISLPKPTWINLQSTTTIFNILHSGPSAAQLGSLPEIPSASKADEFVQTVFFYTQARYCIVDWVRVHQWNQDRDRVCRATTDDDVEDQTAAYFTWLMYAIGAQFVRGSEQLSIGYCARAIQHLGTVLSRQNLSSVQALLTLMQYQFRAPGGPSIWHLVGVALRLCVELGYHRKPTDPLKSEQEDAYTIELQKRFFWCTYCFDRMVSIMSKRPFGIHDGDIDIEPPVDVDVTCTDETIIRDLQAKQAAGEPTRDGNFTTLSAAVHHLQIYRIRSRMITRFSGPHSMPPTYDDVMEFLAELDIWRQHAPRNTSPSTIPVQCDEQVQSTYFQAALILIRPILIRTAIDQGLLYQCATLSADACESARALSLSPETFNSPITVYNCFRCGVTLLQCLAVQPTILPLRRALRAISQCSSALAVFSRSLDTAQPLLRLFDMLSDQFIGEEDQPEMCPNLANLRSILQRITSSGPSETLQLLQTLIEESEAEENNTPDSQAAVDVAETGNNEYDFLVGTDSMSTFGMNLIMPFEMFSEFPMPNNSSQDTIPFWMGMSQ